MSVLVSFTNIVKRLNSTKRSSGGTVKACEIVDNCSILNPIMKLNSRVDSNYCYIGVFGRFYYVVNSWFEGGFWYYKMRVDVLASFKTEIMSEDFIFERTSDTSITGSGYLQDTFYPLQSDPVLTKISSETYPLSATSMANGMYVVGMVGQDGLNTYYGFTSAQFKAFCAYVFGNTANWMNDTYGTITREAMKFFANPTQYITSCMWLPLSIDKFSAKSVVNSIGFGFWNFPVSGYLLNGYQYSFTVNLSVLCADHPDVVGHPYFNYYPFRQLKLCWYPFGVIPIDTTKKVDSGLDGDSLRGAVKLDVYTGVALLTIFNANDVRYKCTAQVGVPIQISSVQNNFIQGGSDTASGISDMASGNIFGGSFETVAGLADMSRQDISKFNSQGSAIAGSEGVTMVTSCYKPVWYDDNRYGIPSGGHGSMKTGNYYKCVEPHVQTKNGMMDEECSEIESMLRGGVYCE